LLLQLADLARQRGLGDAQRLRRAGDAAEPRHLDEAAQFTKIHRGAVQIR